MKNEFTPVGVGGYNPGAGIQNRTAPQKRALTCTCGCPYLEEKHIGIYDAEQSVMIGTPLMTLNGEPPFVIYVCIACGQPVEQPLHFMGVDPSREDHNKILKLFQDRAPEEQPVDPTDG